MFERFTDRARRVLVLAQEEARALGHGFIGTEHILLGLISEEQGVAARALEALDISLEAVRDEVIEIIGERGHSDSGSPPFTPRAKKVLELSLREALALKHNYIGTEHILLGIVREGEGVGAHVLVRLGADLERTRAQVLVLIADYPPPGDAPAGDAAHVNLKGDPPYCPRCRYSLVDNLVFTTLEAKAEPDSDAPTIPVVVISCQSCSVALGTAPPAST